MVSPAPPVKLFADKPALVAADERTGKVLPAFPSSCCTSFIVIALSASPVATAASAVILKECSEFIALRTEAAICVVLVSL
mgnify:CR=1 FL=1